MSMVSPKLPIAFVMPSMSRAAGGLQSAVAALGLELDRTSIAVRVLAIEDAFSKQDALTWAPITPRTFAPSLPLPGWSTGLKQAIADEDAAVLHQHGLWQAWSADVAARTKRTGTPVLISPHGMLDPWALKNSAWKKRLAMALFERTNLKSAACLHALNAAEAQAMRSLGLTNPVAIIPNAIADAHPSTDYARPASLAGDDRKILLFLGRIHPKKGISETLRAWALVLRERPSLGNDWALAIAGWDDGNHQQALEAEASQLGLLKHVHFTGPVFGPDKAALFSHASAFILASHSEGQPMAVLEAWSYRLPVFMTMACNMPEAFPVHAAVEITTDVAAMARTLLEHLAAPELARLGVAGQALVEERFVWNRVAEQYAGVYRWLAAGGTMPSVVDGAERR